MCYLFKGSITAFSGHGPHTSIREYPV